MMEDSASPGYSPLERNRIIIDIMHRKCELEIDSEFQAALNNLRGLSDVELKQFWKEAVGEWLASRDDLSVRSGPDTSADADFDDWLDTQFEKLVNGELTDYGYIVTVDVQADTRDASPDFPVDLSTLASLEAFGTEQPR